MEPERAISGPHFVGTQAGGTAASDPLWLDCEDPSGMILMDVSRRKFDAAELLCRVGQSWCDSSPGVENEILERWMTRSRLWARLRLAWDAGAFTLTFISYAGLAGTATLSACTTYAEQRPCIALYY